MKGRPREMVLQALSEMAETKKDAEVQVKSVDLCQKKETRLMWHVRGVLSRGTQNRLEELAAILLS